MPPTHGNETKEEKQKLLYVILCTDKDILDRSRFSAVAANLMSIWRSWLHNFILEVSMSTTLSLNTTRIFCIPAVDAGRTRIMHSRPRACEDSKYFPRQPHQAIWSKVHAGSWGEM